MALSDFNFDYLRTCAMMRGCLGQEKFVTVINTSLLTSFYRFRFCGKKY